MVVFTSVWMAPPSAPVSSVFWISWCQPLAALERFLSASLNYSPRFADMTQRLDQP